MAIKTTVYIHHNATSHLVLPLELVQAIRETLALPAKPILLAVGKRLWFDGRGQAVLVVRPEATREVAEQDVVVVVRIPAAAPEERGGTAGWGV